MEGYIKIYRRLLEWEWYDDTNTKVVFLHCLLKANYADRNWRGVEVKRGQFITSVATMTEELNLTAMQVRTALGKLKRTGEITIETTNKCSVVSVCNYDSYQDADEREQQTNEQSTEQADNKQTTSKQQTNNNNIRRKEEKNNNNNNNDNKNTTPNGDSAKSPSRFQKPTIEDVRSYVIIKGYNIDADRFWNYYESNGWKVGRNAMKDWRAAVRTWVYKDDARHRPTTTEGQRAGEGGMVDLAEEMSRLQAEKARQREERENRLNTLNL